MKIQITMDAGIEDFSSEAWKQILDNFEPLNAEKVEDLNKIRIRLVLVGWTKNQD